MTTVVFETLLITLTVKFASHAETGTEPKIFYSKATRGLYSKSRILVYVVAVVPGFLPGSNGLS